jgi:imidazolonepropionase-like amidohydrolase
LNQDAAKAYAKGKASGVDVSETQALQWITLSPAKIMGIEKFTGSLEKGKWADLVLWDKHPFSVYAKAQKVLIKGIFAYDRSRDKGLKWSDFLLGQE